MRGSMAYWLESLIPESQVQFLDKWPQSQSMTKLWAVFNTKLYDAKEIVDKINHFIDRQNTAVSTWLDEKVKEKETPGKEFDSQI